MVSPINNPTEELRLKIADWVDDYAETLLGSEYSGRIDRGECLDGLIDLFHQEATKSRLDELARSYTHMDELGKHEYYDERFNTLKATLDKTGGEDEA